MQKSPLRVFPHCRRLLLLFLLPLAVSFGHSQAVFDDFEGNGTIASWAGDNCGLNTGLSNPVASGTNTSATVLEYRDNGASFANVRFDVNGTFDLVSSPVFNLKIYVPSAGLTGNQPNQVSLKLQDNTLGQPWVTQSEIIKSIALDQWQTVSFDFANDPYLNFDPNSLPPTSRSDFNRVVLQVNGENNSDLVLAYFDDVTFQGTLSGGTIYTQLVWSDEFNGNGAIDPSKWYHQTQFPNGSSWFNGEVQHYTNRTDNSFVSGGDLHLVLKRESFFDQGQFRDFTSARLNSKFAFTHGRVEVRAKMPSGLGTWPAIWMLGKNIIEPGAFWTSQFGTTYWPACGEIDIMEHWGYNPNYVQAALHTPSSSGSTINFGGTTLPDVFNTYHVYALDWSPTEMKFSVDGIVYYTYAPNPQNFDNWPFNGDQYLILNIAMAGNIDPNFTQSEMVVDYVRVYQEPGTVATESAPALRPQLYPNPVARTLQIDLPHATEAALVEVHASTGQLLNRARLGAGQIHLDWSAYPAGIYLVTLSDGPDRTTHKVLKQ
ncbi:MAG: family 16 glycosylhydrolase [Bacteroidota bacterium]